MNKHDRKSPSRGDTDAGTALAGYGRQWLVLAMLVVGCSSFSVQAQSQEEFEDSDRCSSDEPGFCLDGVSSTVTSFDGLRVNSRGSAIGKRQQGTDEADISSPTVGAMLMMAMGDGALAGYSPWLGYSRSRFDSDVRIARYDAEVDNLQIGVDRMWGNDWLLGVALGSESIDTQTRYNGGGQQADGVTITAYGSHWLDEACSLNLMLGYGTSSTDQSRIDPDESNPGNPAIGRASYDATRLLADFSGSLLRHSGRWVGGSRLGVLYASERVDGYTETGLNNPRTVGDSTPELLQFYVSGEASRSFRHLDVYGLLGYRYDIARDEGQEAGALPAGIETVPDDRDEVELALGVRMFRANGFAASLEWLETLTRDDFSNSTISLLVRMEF